MRWIVRIVGGLIVILLIAASTVYAMTEQRLSHKYQIAPWKGKAGDASNAQVLARGKHIANTRGCLECHKADGRGGLFVDAMPVMRLFPPNITPQGVTKSYRDVDWERAIRHCVKPSGLPIPFMPCIDNARLSEDDLSALIAFMRTLKPQSQETERSVLGPLGRVLYAVGELPYAHAEHIDHTRARASTPTPGPTKAYGAYLADTCMGCHGERLSGGPIPGVPPEWPAAANLTPHKSGLATLTQAQFVAVMRTGTRPDGRRINPEHMPWRQFALFSDDELTALWLHLQALPPADAGGR